MARLKSAYREKPQPELSPEPNIPEVKIDGVEAKPDMAVALDISPEQEQAPAVAEALQKVTEADEAANALRKQISELRRVEELQQMQRQIANIHLLPLDQKIEIWKANGLSDVEADFIREHPHIADHPRLSNYFEQKALDDGHERDSPEYFAAVKSNFEEQMRQMQAQAAQTAPEYFRPPAPKSQPASPRASAMNYSAPVSREAPTSGPRIETNPSQVRLSAEEVEIAKASGISLTEYARQKLRLEAEKRSGIRQRHFVQMARRQSRGFSVLGTRAANLASRRRAGEAKRVDILRLNIPRPRPEVFLPWFSPSRDRANAAAEGCTINNRQ